MMEHFFNYDWGKDKNPVVVLWLMPQQEGLIYQLLTPRSINYIL